MSEPAYCQRCGRRSPSDPPPVDWSGGTERGRQVWVCDRCTRENLRSIEGKLSPDWW